MQSSAAEEGLDEGGGAGMIGRMKKMERGALDSERKLRFPVNEPAEPTAYSPTGLQGDSRGDRG